MLFQNFLFDLVIVLVFSILILAAHMVDSSSKGWCLLYMWI